VIDRDYVRELANGLILEDDSASDAGDSAVAWLRSLSAAQRETVNREAERRGTTAERLVRDSAEGAHESASADRETDSLARDIRGRMRGVYSA
jgi:hypothetical protein